MRVLVRFKGDNDFGSVMRAFGDLLLRQVENERETLTPERIATNPVGEPGARAVVESVQ